MSVMLLKVYQRCLDWAKEHKVSCTVSPCSVVIFPDGRVTEYGPWFLGFKDNNGCGLVAAVALDKEMLIDYARINNLALATVEA